MPAVVVSAGRLELTFAFAGHDPDMMSRAGRIVRPVDGKIAEDLRQ